MLPFYLALGAMLATNGSVPYDVLQEPYQIMQLSLLVSLRVCDCCLPVDKSPESQDNVTFQTFC